jgi:ribose 5-phosphate isomerase B
MNKLSNRTISISIGSDHGGFKVKEEIISFLKRKKYNVRDRGCFSEERCDYPDYGILVSEDVAKKKSKYGILICTSGIGMSIVANKFPGIRAALCTSVGQAKMAAEHNNANILCLSAKFNTLGEIKKIITTWLNTRFAGGRHLRRINKIKRIEEVLYGENNRYNKG